MPDLDRYLYDRLRTQAAGVDVPPGDIETVMARGRHRRHRRAGASLLAVMAAAGTVTGVVVSTSSGGRAAQISVGSPTRLPAATADNLTWRVLPATKGLSDLSSQASSGSIAYAVSTAPGVVATGSEPAQQLYRSADGLSWTTATGPTGLSAGGVAAFGNRVYTVGTGLATAATGGTGTLTTAVSWTDNGGGSWHDSALPVDMQTPAGAVTVDGEAVSVAAGPKGVVAAVSINATVDLSRMVAGVSASALWTANTSGVEVLGSPISPQCGFAAADKGSAALRQKAALKLKAKAPRTLPAGFGQNPLTHLGTPPAVLFAPHASEGQLTTTVPCVDASGQITRFVPADQAYRVVKSYSWSQLKVGGQVERVLRGQPLVFFSSDGTHFRPVSLPSGASGPADVTATPGGFAMEVPGQEGPPLVMQSVDGQHWSLAPFPLPSSATGASGIGYVDGHLVVVGQTLTGSAAYTWLSDGWQTTPLPGNLMGVSFGSLGVGVVAASASGDPGAWQVLFSHDGLRWSTASLFRLSGGPVGDANVVVGAHQIVVTVTKAPTGSPAGGPPVQLQLVGTPAG